MSINKVILIGNVGRKPELVPMDGYKIANFSLATNDKSKNGEVVTQWHNVSVTNHNADFADKYIEKGHSVYLEGALKTRQVTDKSGNKRYYTEVRAYTLQKLTPAEKRNDGYKKQQKTNQSDFTDSPF